MLRQCGRVVVDEQPVLEVLAGVGEVQAEQLGVAARGRRTSTVGDADQVAAEGDDDVPERRVAADAARVCCATCTASSAQSCS